MPGPTDEAWLRAELRADRRRRKWAPFKGEPERQCTATTRSGKRCRAPKAKRLDGTLNTVCRFHGGTPKSLEQEIRALEGYARYKRAQLRGIETKLALLKARLNSPRDMAADSIDPNGQLSLALNREGIDDTQSNRVVSGSSQSNSQARAIPEGAVQVGSTDRLAHIDTAQAEIGAATGRSDPQ